MNILSVIANKKYTSSAKQASRYTEDVEEAITKCSKNIKRSIEDAQDEANKALRQLEQKIEDLSTVTEVNVDEEVGAILEKAREFEPKDFLLRLDRAFQKEECEKDRIAENADLSSKLQKGYDEAKRLIDLGEDLLSVAKIDLGDASELSSVKCAIATLRGRYAEQARMARIKELLASEASDDVVKKD